MSKQLLLILATAALLLQASSAQTTDFTFSNTSNVCLPADVHFTQTSTGTPKGYLWDFGNGTHSNLANPVAIYNAAGSYSVRLITVYNNSTAEKIHTVTVHPAISSNFTADRTTTCQPGVINFSASVSEQLSSFIWNFGDSTPAVSSTSSTISHNFTSYGEFTVTLTANSTTGCSATTEKLIKIIEPQISGTVAVIGACTPASASFTSTVNLMQGSSVAGCSWNFGDGTIVNSASLQASHSYTLAGNYAPTLTITTSEGCTKLFRFDSVSFGTPPINMLAHSDDSVYCGSETPMFFATATNANRYDWQFNSPSITSVSDNSTEHRFTSIGTKTITVTPAFNGCSGSPVSFNIKIIGVIAKFKYKNTCGDKKTFQFQNQTQGHVSTLLWTLDNQTISSDLITIHTFPQTGTFDSRIDVTDNLTGCVDSMKAKIYTANPGLQNADVSLCINTDTRFKVINNYSNPALSYLWNVIGKEIGPGAEDTLTAHADTLGHFNNSVILDNGITHYCPDTIRLDHIISVKGPLLDFTTPASICINSGLTVTNLSHPFQPADSVKLWYWNFGRTPDNDTTFQPEPYNYFIAKAYRIKLTAVDVNGCSDTLVKKVFVRPMPFLWIIPKTSFVCSGQSKTLIGYTSDSISWLPAATTFCTTCDTTNVSPVETTTYYATSSNQYNCVTSDSAVVQVAKAFTASAITPDSYICAGEKVKLEVEPSNKKISWAQVDGLSGLDSYNPTAAPVHTSIYQATLSDSAGCFTTTVDIKITVKSKPTVDAGADKTFSYSSEFTLAPTYSSNVRSWTWTNADSLSCSACPTPSGIATESRKYQVKVISDSGCIATDEVAINVNSNLFLPTAFTPNNDNLNDLFHPLARGIKVISRFTIYNRQGQLVYELRNFTPNKERYGWDGKFRGRDQEAAAYICVAEGIADKGETVTVKGSFLLIR